MATLVLGAVGAGIGGAIGGTFLGMSATAIGWQVGSTIGSLIGGSGSKQRIEGPRLGDLRVQASTYGQSIPRIYGSYRIAGNMIWSKPIKETVHKTKIKSGGKGMGKQKASQITYTYSQSFAIAICEGPIISIRKIWANGELVYNVGADASPSTLAASHKFAQNFTFYNGTEDQMPNSIIQADVGVDNTPAYRGVAYIVFDDLQLEKYGNRTPNLEFEVVTIADVPIWTRYDDGFEMPISGIDTLTYDGERFVGLKRVFQILPEPPFFILQTYLLTSPDGTEWEYEPVLGDLSDSVLSMTTIEQVNNGRLLTSGAGASIYRSDDAGESWIETYTDDAPDYLLHISGDLVVGLISGATPDNRFLYSIDNGLNWTVASFDFTGAAMSSLTGGPAIATDGSTIIAVGVSGAIPYVARSTDGMTWTEAILDNLQTEPYDYFITYGDGVWIIGNTFGDIYRSTDSTTWTKVTTLPFPFYTTIAFGNTMFLIAAMAGYSYMSGDSGLTWTAIQIEGGLRNLQLKYGNEHFIATFPTYTTAEEPYDEVAGAVWMLPAMLGKEILLKDIVEAECAIVGIEGSEIDASELLDKVTGFAITNRATVRSGIEPLSAAYAFDGVEVDAVLKFVKRGGGLAAIIPEDELAAHEWGSQQPDIAVLERTQDVELPDEITVNYADADAAYQIGSQYSRRLIGSSRVQNSISMPLAVTAHKAKNIADVLMYAAWQGRTQFSFSTSVKYSYLVPTDVVAIVKSGIIYTVRIVGKDEQGTQITFTAVGEDLQVYNQDAPAPRMPAPVSDVPIIKETLLYLLDIPLLLDFDTVPNFYSAVISEPGPGDWNGAQLFQSFDDVTYESFGLAHDIEATIGEAVDVLGDFTENTFDEANTVTVTLLGGALFSTSEFLVLNGDNAALLGDEIIQFKTATLVSGTTYVLSGLLRGRRGTEWACSTHQAGERFVLLEEETVLPQNFNISNINSSRYFKAITVGNMVDDDPNSEYFTWRANCLRPYSPVNLGGGRADDDLTITWVRRTRVSGEWHDYSDVPLGEETELYEVEIWNSTYTTLYRTFTGLTTPEVTYTAAEQIEDFGSAQSTVYVRIFQVSSVVGRGYALEGNI